MGVYIHKGIRIGVGGWGGWGVRPVADHGVHQKDRGIMIVCLFIPLIWIVFKFDLSGVLHGRMRYSLHVFSGR